MVGQATFTTPCAPAPPATMATNNKVSDFLAAKVRLETPARWHPPGCLPAPHAWVPWCRASGAGALPAASAPWRCRRGLALVPTAADHRPDARPPTCCPPRPPCPAVALPTLLGTRAGGPLLDNDAVVLAVHGVSFGWWCTINENRRKRWSAALYIDRKAMFCRATARELHALHAKISLRDIFCSVKGSGRLSVLTWLHQHHLAQRRPFEAADTDPERAVLVFAAAPDAHARQRVDGGVRRRRGACG